MNWLRRWFARRKQREVAIRAAQRYSDSLLLFPRWWRDTGGDPAAFLAIANSFTATSPAWRHGHEWHDTPENPGRWAAREYAKGSTRG